MELQGKLFQFISTRFPLYNIWERYRWRTEDQESKGKATTGFFFFFFPFFFSFVNLVNKYKAFCAGDHSLGNGVGESCGLKIVATSSAQGNQLKIKNLVNFDDE